MLSIKDRLLVPKLKRRILIIVLLLFFCLYWLRTKYLDEQYLEDEVEIMQYELFDLEDQIKNLQLKIDSLQKKEIVLEKTKDKIIINKKQVEKTKDSTLPKIIEYAPEHISEEPMSDTLHR